MKTKLNHLLSCLSVIAVFLLQGCSEEPLTTSPELNLESSGISVAAESGDYSVEYTVTNQGSETVSVSEDVQWIYSCSVDVPGTLTFSVEENESESPREGTIMLSCGNSTVSLKVTQAGMSAMSFEISVLETTPGSVRFKVVPDTEGNTYLALLRTKEDMDAFTNDEECFQADLKKFQAVADGQGVTLSELLAEVLVAKENIYPLYELVPGADYYIYAYGLTADGVRTTPIVKTPLKMEDAVSCTFDIGVDIVDYKAEVTVEPSDKTISYYINVLDSDRYLKFGGKMPDAAQNDISQFIGVASLAGLGREETVAEIQKVGNSSMNDFKLNPDTDYIAYACAIDKYGSVISDVSYYEFHTESSGDASDLKFEFEISGLESDRVEVKFIPSDPSCMYWSAIAGSDETAESIKTGITELAESFIEGGWNEDMRDYMLEKTSRGVSSMTASLVPGKTYRPYAIGVSEDGSFATDVIFGDEFTAPELEFSQNLKIDIELDKYFNGDDLADLDFYRYGNYEGRAAVPVNVVIEEGEAVNYYFSGYSDAEFLDEEAWPDHTIINTLKNLGRDQNDSHLMSYQWNVTIVVCAVAVDKDGKYSKVVRKPIICKKSEASDISEFEE